MRLSQKTVTTLISSVESSIIFQHHGCPLELRLYGSRVDDSQKGGDIDLLLILDENTPNEEILRMKLDMLVTLKTALGDQKIDLSIAKPSQLNTQPFLKVVFPGSVLLKKWV